MIRRSAFCAALGMLLACQASAPERRAPVLPIPSDVADRFDLNELPETPTIDPVHVIGSSLEADALGVDAPSASIELSDVLTSVDLHFPLILAAQEEIAIAEAGLLAAQGGFDTRLDASGFARTDGFRESERLDFGVVQPTPFWGATFEGGYKLGLGDFDEYEQGSQTNGNGEARLGVNVPLLQGREIDSRRVKVWQARIKRDIADPKILEKRLEVARKATDSYWKWVAAGRVREITLRLLALANARTTQVADNVRAGLLAEMSNIENEQLQVEREAALLRADRKLQQAAIQLSLYWRDGEGRPLVPGEGMLPYDFPAVRPADEILIDEDAEFALKHRPEIKQLELGLDALGLDQELARNLLLPTVDVGVFGSQDWGTPASDPDDKGEFEFGFLLDFELPIQLRQAEGGVQRLRAQVRQFRRQAQFLRETLITEVQDARSALTQSWLGIEQARRNAELANELAELERFDLDIGRSNLLRVNFREQRAAGAAASYVEVLRLYFQSVAYYRAVIGVPTGADY